MRHYLILVLYGGLFPRTYILKLNIMRKTLSIVENAKIVFNMKWNQLQSWFKIYWFKVSLLLVVVLMLNQKDLNLQLNLSASPQKEQVVLVKSVADQEESKRLFQRASQLNIGANIGQFFNKKSSPSANEENSNPVSSVSITDQTDNLSNTYSNMTYGSSTSGKKASSRKLAKLKKQEAYVKRFGHIAQSEMRKYGIPASIKLAQGLIESNAGESALSKRNNNHFGMKCFSRNCKKGHCSNFTDDSHKDFFRTYKSAWESYRSHSKMLNGERYRHLLQLEKTNYKSWAFGLKKAGYATDKRYAQKLINIIEELKLHEFDKI